MNIYNSIQLQNCLFFLEGGESDGCIHPFLECDGHVQVRIVQIIFLYEGSKKWKKYNHSWKKKTLRCWCWQRNPSSFEDIFQLKTQFLYFFITDANKKYLLWSELLLRYNTMNYPKKKMFQYAPIVALCLYNIQPENLVF